MHEELGFFDKFAAWMSEHWGWLSGLAIFLAWAATKVIAFFNGINRLADNQAKFHTAITERMDKLTDEQRLQREKLERMVDSDGVDLRVAPVIETVTTMQGQISQIYNHLLNRSDKKERATDE